MACRGRSVAILTALAVTVMSCTSPRSAGGPVSPSPTFSPAATQTTGPIDSRVPVVVGTPIEVSSLTGRIVLSTEDDVYTANADGSGSVKITHAQGAEFDPSWSPNGTQIVYRDSTRGINQNDEIYVVNADGSDPRNLTRDPADDWGPDWSPDGRTIVFNSTRDGMPMGGFLVHPDRSHLRRIPTDVYVEYPSWSPDGNRIAFMGGPSGPSEYDIWTVDVNGRHLTQLTGSPGPDGWPAWSPDGTQIAFTSVRDDCFYSDALDCRTTGDIGPHHDVWVVNADGTGLHRVTFEFGQFVTWSPDGRYLLVSGYDLYVIRPDGTGRASLEIRGMPGSGLFPDWIA